MNGNDLKKILRMKGITQVDVANLLGITRQSVSAMLGSASIKTTTLEKIAKGFKIDIAEFFGHQGSTEENAMLRKQVEELKEDLKKKDETINRLIKIIENMR